MDWLKDKDGDYWVVNIVLMALFYPIFSIGWVVGYLTLAFCRGFDEGKN